MRCNWTCEGCWSMYGWTSMEAVELLEPAEVVERLEGGMRRYGIDAARISGGEPAMHWTHMCEVVERFLAVQGRTLIIETSASFLRPQDFDELEQRIGPRAARLTFVVGVKATSPEWLARLTGLPLAVAERRWRRMLENVMHLHRATGLDVYASFLDRFCEPALYADLHSRGVKVTCIEYRKYNSNRFYTPRRFRTKGTTWQQRQRGAQPG